VYYAAMKNYCGRELFKYWEILELGNCEIDLNALNLKLKMP
jgi:hypothetical protein